MATRRELTRAATIDEIKQTALRLMRESGSTGVRFSDIAREMGMTPPALYRYFPTRDELLTALIVDAFGDLHAALIAARDALPSDDIPGRLGALCQAYRSWALQEPERFALLFSLPAPGYTAPEDGPTKEAAGRTFAPFYELVAAAGLHEVPFARFPADVDLHCPFPAHGEMPPEVHANLLLAWSSLHGFTSLEAHDHFKWLSQEAVDALFAALQQSLAAAMGLAVEPPTTALAPTRRKRANRSSGAVSG